MTSAGEPWESPDSHGGRGHIHPHVPCSYATGLRERREEIERHDRTVEGGERTDNQQHETGRVG